MPYNWETASRVLSEVEKNRIVCVYLNATIENSQIDWKKATDEFGSKSVDAMKKGVANSLKKLEAEQGKEGGEGSSPVKSPAKKTPAKNGGKKRKAAAVDEGEGGEDGEEKPAPKKRGRKPKVKEAVVAGEDGVEDGVKAEEVEE